LERIIRTVLQEHARILVKGEAPAPTVPVVTPSVSEIVKPEVKVPELPKVEVPSVKPTILFEAGRTETLSARRNRVFAYKDTRGTLFYFIMRSASKDYTVYLTVDGREMINGKTYEELEPDSAKIDWYMASYDYDQSEYVFGLFNIMWEKHFILIVEPNSEMSAIIKYSGVMV
jgi:hypothetical protein